MYLVLSQCVAKVRKPQCGLSTSKIYLSPRPCGFGCCPFLGGGFLVVDAFFIAAPIVCGGSVLRICYIIQCFMSF